MAGALTDVQRDIALQNYKEFSTAVGAPSLNGHHNFIERSS
jgi:hypothetical protein